MWNHCHHQDNEHAFTAGGFLVLLCYSPFLSFPKPQPSPAPRQSLMCFLSLQPPALYKWTHLVDTLLSVFFHSAELFWESFMLFYVPATHCSSRSTSERSIVPLYWFFYPPPVLMGICIASSFCLLQVKLLGAFMEKSLYGYTLSFVLGRIPRSWIARAYSRQMLTF